MVAGDFALYREGLAQMNRRRRAHCETCHIPIIAPFVILYCQRCRLGVAAFMDAERVDRSRPSLLDSLRRLMLAEEDAAG